MGLLLPANGGAPDATNDLIMAPFAPPPLLQSEPAVPRIVAGTPRRLLLVCGIVSSLVYVAASMLVGMRWQGAPENTWLGLLGHGFLVASATAFLGFIAILCRSWCSVLVVPAMLTLTACGGSGGAPAVDLIVGRWVVPGGAGEAVAVFTADGQYTIPTEFVYPPGIESGSWSRRNEHELNLQCTAQCPRTTERTIDVRVDDHHLMLGQLYLGSSTVAEGSAWSRFYKTIDGGSCLYHVYGSQLRLTTNGMATSVDISMCTPVSMNAHARRIAGTWTPAPDGFVVSLPGQAPVAFFLMEDAVSSTRWERAL